MSRDLRGRLTSLEEVRSLRRALWFHLAVEALVTVALVVCVTDHVRP